MRPTAMDTSGGSTQCKASKGTQRSAGAAKSYLVVPGRRLIVVASSDVVGPEQGGDAIFRLVDLTVVPNLA